MICTSCNRVVTTKHRNNNSVRVVNENESTVKVSPVNKSVRVVPCCQECAEKLK